MSMEYDQYLKKHKDNVKKGFEWIKENTPYLLDYSKYGVFDYEWYISSHDFSKSKIDEYEPYDKYFYGNNKSFSVIEDFNYAWLLHIHRNPHHWQHWVLINDEPGEGTKALDMPWNYIIEMICDWWSFSWNSGDLYELFTWYDNHKDHMILSEDTRQNVEFILEKIKYNLDFNKEEELENGRD